MFSADSTAERERNDNMTDKELREKAEEIARSMRERGLQAWHIKYELKIRAYPPMIEEKLAKLIEQKLQ